MRSGGYTKALRSGEKRRAKKPLWKAACRLWLELFFASPANNKTQTGQASAEEEEGGGFGDRGRILSDDHWVCGSLTGNVYIDTHKL